MSIIPCALNCIHQDEGYCGLEIGSSVTNCSGGCPHFVTKAKIIEGEKNNGQVIKPIRQNQLL